MSLQRKLAVATKVQPEQQMVTQATIDHLQKEAEGDLKEVLSKVARAFDEQLSGTTQRLSQHVEEVADKVMQDELTKYQNTLNELRQASVERLSQVQGEIEKRREQMEADLVAEIASEKQRQLEGFDDKIADVVSAFLVEVLGNQADLGAQSHYLMSVLEENKDELKKAILREP
jgi:replication-associated recombination protein RarA